MTMKKRMKWGFRQIAGRIEKGVEVVLPPRSEAGALIEEEKEEHRAEKRSLAVPFAPAGSQTKRSVSVIQFIINRLGGKKA